MLLRIALNLSVTVPSSQTCTNSNRACLNAAQRLVPQHGTSLLMIETTLYTILEQHTVCVHLHSHITDADMFLYYLQIVELRCVLSTSLFRRFVSITIVFLSFYTFEQLSLSEIKLLSSPSPKCPSVHHMLFPPLSEEIRGL